MPNPGATKNTPPSESREPIEPVLLRGPSRLEVIATRLLSGMLPSDLKVAAADADQYVDLAVMLAAKLAQRVDAAEAQGQ